MHAIEQDLWNFYFQNGPRELNPNSYPRYDPISSVSPTSAFNVRREALQAPTIVKNLKKIAEIHSNSIDPEDLRILNKILDKGFPTGGRARGSLLRLIKSYSEKENAFSKDLLSKNTEALIKKPVPVPVDTVSLGEPEPVEPVAPETDHETPYRPRPEPVPPRTTEENARVGLALQVLEQLREGREGLSLEMTQRAQRILRENGYTEEQVRELSRRPNHVPTAPATATEEPAILRSLDLMRRIQRGERGILFGTEILTGTDPVPPEQPETVTITPAMLARIREEGRAAPVPEVAYTFVEVADEDDLEEDDEEPENEEPFLEP